MSSRGCSTSEMAMPMNSFDVYTTVIFPIFGGIIAGVIVILIEWSFRVLHEWNQRKRGTKVVSRFFGEWEDAINTSADLPESPSGISYAKPQSTEEMSVAAWLRGKKVLL